METVPHEAHETFSGEIRTESAKTLLAKMNEHVAHGVEQVVLDVSSCGGEVAQAKGLYKELSLMGFKLITRNIGEVKSMANLLMLAGNERLAVPGSTFLLHPIAVEHELEDHSRMQFDLPTLERTLVRHEANRNQEQVAKYHRWIGQVKREDQELQEILERETALPKAEAIQLIQAAQPFDAAFALRAGFINAIASSTASRAAP
ncbi:MAG TPA: ATP-dependent Clp protease proteolytic subunit [Solirubrobacteraceae bacterium]|jgi:ATP-dependent protease ClpP protease subunit|nr:ATP-dependent Clp protease proteolytic subunit [Solirubrobacteraceae bacterium]